MKLKIPPSNKVFGKIKKPTKPTSIEKIVVDWLNTEVYQEIISSQPKLSPTELKVTGFCHVEVPPEYSTNINEFKRITKAKLVPLGYQVDFTYDGNGITRDICYIKWVHIL